jgi:DNA-binding transcriptional LysR family regulator
MSIRQLRTLIAIADTGSFGAAADVMHVTQSAVSMQMRALEEEFRIELFDRARRPPSLNAYGRRLVERARELVALYDEMLGAAGDVEELSGTLTLGAVPTSFTGLVPKALMAMRRAYPKLHINVVTELSAPLVDHLFRGEIDAAVLTKPRQEIEGIDFRAVAAEQLVVIAPPGAPQETAREVLLSYPYIRFSRRAWVGRAVEEALRENNISVNVTMELDTLEAISIMVFYGLGASIVPVPCVPHPSPLPIKSFPFGGTTNKRVIGFAELRENPKSRLTSALYTELVHAAHYGGFDEEA